MAYNIIQYDSSNLKILNNIETLNGDFISKGQNVISNVSNYVLTTSNILTAHINDLDSKIFDSSNLVKIERLPVAKYDANGSKLGIIKVDGITITVDESGIIRGNSNIDLSAYATKNELSSVASGLTVLENVDLATTININLSGSVDYTTNTIDGAWPISGSSILLKNQTNKAQNGIYILTLTSAPTYSTWQRRSDFNTPQNIKKGSYVFIKRGVENKNTGFINSLDITTLNTDPIEFNLFTKTEITAGNGIALSGSTVSIKASANGGIVFNSDSAEINLSGSAIQGILPIVKGGTGANNLTNLINLDTDTNSILPIAKGGTGASSFTNLINLDTDTNSILPLAKGGTGASSFANLINLSTDTNGVLSVAKGGTGTTTLFPNLLIVGNGTNIPLQSANLSWNNDTNTFAATNIAGSGANITNINVGNASAGILPIVRGGTGSSTLTADIIEQGINKRFIINNKISLLNQQDLRVATNIIPDENDKYSLGTSNLRWKDIFVSANTITIGETKLSSSPSGALEMSSVSFTEKINHITSNELHTLSGINGNIQQQINELNLDDIADGVINRYIKNDQYDGSITVYSNLNVGTYYSTENPNGNLRVFGDLILEGSNITTFNPLITQIHRHLSNYNTGFIDIHNIDVSSNKPSIKIKHNTEYSNILECYSKNDMELNNAVFIISSNGNIGIANNTPVEKLDVIGNIKYTGKINNITAAELDYLTGINYNIKQRIDNNDAQQSNFTLNVSNILQTEYKLLDKNVSNYILNVSNILQNSSKETNVSNYILSVSNMLTTDYKRLDNNVSNYILNVSNLLSTDYKMLDKNVSNYVLVSNTNTSRYASNLNIGMSNYLTASIFTTSNTISSRISSLTADNIAQGTQNKYITNNTYSGQLNINSVVDNQSLLNITAAQNNAPDSEIINIKKGTTELFKMISNGFIGVRKGANLPTVPLDVEGDIKFSGKINDITAGELNNLKDINYNIKQRIDTNDSNQSNYISAVNANISQRINTNDSNQSNYISAVNANISQRINTNDSNQSNYISAVNANISQSIANITTDTITQGTQKKFIINDVYDGNLIINSNLTVQGSTTTLNTDVYTTERLDITNINQTSTALTVRQMGESKKIISALKDSEPDVEIFSVNTDGSIDVKGNISFGGDLFKGTEKFKASNWTSNADGIASYSNVAIGKDVAVSSAYKLDVAGNINLSGDLYKAVNNCNYLIQTVKSDLYVRDPSTSTTSNLTAEPVITFPAFPVFKETVQTFINSSGEAQQQHTITLDEDTICDILIVGGGGGGANGSTGNAGTAGGGGAGGVVYMVNKTLNAGTYKINVGKGGGADANGNNSTITDNNNNTLTFDSILLIGRGGGKGGKYDGTRTGSNGGSGGGGIAYYLSTYQITNGGTSTQGNTFWNGTTYIAGGYNGGRPVSNNTGGGGGGSGEAGNTDGAGFGGDGIKVNISGVNTFYAGGGNAAPNFSATRSNGGGGAFNGSSANQNGGNALANTGSGGCAAFGPSYISGGSGGSGIVIIKFKTIVGSTKLEGSPVTHKSLTFSYIATQPTFTLNFPVPTTTNIIDRVSSSSVNNLILQGSYDINLTTSEAKIIPKSGQYLPFTASSNLSPNISLLYHLRNPIKTIEGGQWTYNSSNVNVYNLGSVGIGTTKPEYLLDVSGDIRLTGDLYKGTQKAIFSNWNSNVNGISSYSNIAIGKEVAVSSAYKLDVSGAINSTSLNAVAINSTSLNTGALTSTSLNTGIITSTSYIRPSAGSGDNGIIFPTDPGGGTGDAAWIKYYPRSGEACSLEIGINNDADDHILLNPAGCVGINKVPESAYKLDVAGSIKFNGNLNKNINNINYTVETVRSELYLLSPSANTLTAEPTVSTTIAFAENVKSFTHSGGAEEQTTHTVAVGQNTICDILIVGGGGGGGNFGGGGGGAGGYYYQTNITIPAGNYTINVGKGGIAAPDNNTTGGNGGDTTFYGITAKGGGGGASDNAPTANSGGSGGGAVWNGTAGLDNDTNTDGNNGGTPINTADQNYGSGGGGADSTGFTNGNGGTGKSNSITGATIFYAAGGGGGRNQGTDWSGTGGSSIGGNGGDGATVGTSGLTGSGSGGGGGGGTGGENGGNGGSGIVIIRFKSLAGPTSEGNPVTHKTLSFAYIPSFDYAPPLVNNINVYNLHYGPPTELILPTGYTHFRVDADWGGTEIYIDDVYVTTLPFYSPTQYTQSYTPGQVLRIRDFNVASYTFYISVTFINNTNSYTLNFSVPTITDIIDKNTNNTISKLILQGNYEVRFTATTAQIVATSGQTGQFLPPSNAASILSQNISFRYNMRNPIKPIEGAQWTYNAANTSVYHLGNVGIGNTNPLYSLDVVGNMYVNGNIRTSDTITSFGDYSDERLKDREENIENPLDIVGKLQGFYYRPNKTANDLGIKGNKMNKRELGVSAQDVQKILPELIDIAPADISYDAENNVISKTGSNYLTVNYEKMIPLLIESIKELNKNINELKKENVELRDLIKSQ
jgi:hypothetical protein